MMAYSYLFGILLGIFTLIHGYGQTHQFIKAATPKVRLSNGVEMPLIFQGSGGDNDTSATSGVQAALAVGFTGIDTAHDYGCLAGVGAALAPLGTAERQRLFVTTKVPGCGVPTQGLQPPCYENTHKVFAEDMAKLKTPYVDLLLLHFPPLAGCGGNACMKMQQQWTALEELYKANATRAIGVSNMCKDCIECIKQNMTVMPMVVQMQYHIGLGHDPGGLKSYCNQENIVFESYAPLGGGMLLSNFSLGTELAIKYNFSSSAGVALAYIVQRGRPLVTKSNKPLHLAEDLDLFSPEKQISDADLARLDAVTYPTCKDVAATGRWAPDGCCHSP